MKQKPAAHVFQEQQMQRNVAQVQDLEDFVEAEANAAPPVMYQTSLPAGPVPQTAAPKSRRAISLPLPPMGNQTKSSEELQLEKEPIQVRVTGWWRWKRVVVPPNAYVIHTRLGRKQPVTLGLGLSFRYDPMTDAYLVVPAAMQTIGVVANCISQEKQGINVLAYVQWQISDFSIAYRRLDFSDSRDPLSIVNAQLREQAEAAIKDKIATMSVEEVLTDKAPVIEELTRRLIEVSEGRGGTDTEGLGIKIVTVQIKEAFVSSQRLWEHLQAPYRHAQEQSAQLSLLGMQEVIRVKELENRRLTETSEAETHVEIERIKQSKQTEAQELRLSEETKRFARQQESAHQQKVVEVERQLQEMAEEQRLQDAFVEAEKKRFTREQERLQAEHDFFNATAPLEQARQMQALENQRQVNALQLEIDDAAHRAKTAQQEREIQIARLEQEIRNLITDQDLMTRLIDRLPEVVEHMPEVHEMRVLQMGDTDSAVAGFIKGLLAVMESLKASTNGTSTKVE